MLLLIIILYFKSFLGLKMKFVVALVFVCLSANVLVSGLPQNPTEQAAESGSPYILIKKIFFGTLFYGMKTSPSKFKRFFATCFKH